MTQFIQITNTKKNETLYHSAARIRRLDISRKGATEIRGYSMSKGVIETDAAIDSIAQKVNESGSGHKLLRYLDANGKTAYVSLGYITYIERDKQGNAVLECGFYGSTRDILQTGNPIGAILEQIRALGSAILE